MKTALCFRLRSNSIALRQAECWGQFLANAVHEANAAKARMNLLRKQFLFRASLDLDAKCISSHPSGCSVPQS